MAVKTKIRVLVVDDSELFRQVISKSIEEDECIKVVATAVDAFDAKNKILEYKPDVMLCDIEMPKMNGIEFIRQLLPQYSLPVIVVSTISTAIFDALEVGAVDFVTKPDLSTSDTMENFKRQLISKVKTAVASKAMPRAKTSGVAGVVDIDFGDVSDKIIALGASTGGVEATTELLANLCPTLPGIVVVQHIPPVFSNIYAEKLNITTRFKCKEAQTGDVVSPGCVYIAPGDRHMTVKKIDGKYTIVLKEGEKVNGHCPSIDVLLESVATCAKDKAIGILLTGMGYDGAKGLSKMRRVGARTLAQDEATSVVFGIPKAAHSMGAVERLLALQNMPNYIYSLLR